ncbi:hypothetical protein L4C33_07645 [Vibrio makurazakiensis]|uniref:hypothetical protein n=1 Tax=Vibrio makurazakiensis TaxID=2910250 RepID=UPI003D1229D5
MVIQLKLIHSIEHGSALCEPLFDLLSKHQPEYQRSLIPDLTFIDVMAHNNHGIVIQKVSHIEANQYQCQYSYDWEIFNGCLDMHETGVERNKVKFIVTEEGQVEFDLNAFQDRDTLNEF